MRRRGANILHTIDSRMVMLSALRADRPLPTGRFVVFISVTGWKE
jgi:hypothetical protein